MGRRCRPKKQAVGKTSRGYILSLLAMTQFVFPEGDLPDSGKWDAQEDGPNGLYIADYQKQTPGKKKSIAPSSALYTKTKARYLQPQKKSTTRTIEITTTVVPKGRLEALFNFADGRLISISGTESEDFLINKKKVGHARNTIKFSFMGKEALSGEEMSSLSGARAALATGKEVMDSTLTITVNNVEKTVLIDDKTKITRDGKPVPSSDIMVGSKVQISFIERAGKKVATAIVLRSSGAEPKSPAPPKTTLPPLSPQPGGKTAPATR